MISSAWGSCIGLRGGGWWWTVSGGWRAGRTRGVGVLRRVDKMRDIGWSGAAP